MKMRKIKHTVGTSLIDFYCFKSIHACVWKLLLSLFMSFAILRAGIFNLVSSRYVRIYFLCMKNSVENFDVIFLEKFLMNCFGFLRFRLFCKRWQKIEIKLRLFLFKTIGNINVRTQNGCTDGGSKMWGWTKERGRELKKDWTWKSKSECSGPEM